MPICPWTFQGMECLLRQVPWDIDFNVLCQYKCRPTGIYKFYIFVKIICFVVALQFGIEYFRNLWKMVIIFLIY